MALRLTRPIVDAPKRLPAARNEENSPKNAFPRREMGIKLQEASSRGGKWRKFSEKRFPVAGE